MPVKTLFSKPVERQTLADQLADEIKRLILTGTLRSGDVLPSEMELAEQYGVSRAVIRDATRVLMALGLVEVIHGRGVFISPPENEAFGDALFLALQRQDATVWDVEQFELSLFPQVVSLAALEATDEDVATIRALTAKYLETYESALKIWEERSTISEVEDAKLRESLRSSFRTLMESIFAATHNKVLQILANPLLQLRNLREWQMGHASVEFVENETAYFQTILDAIESRDPTQALDITTRVMQLPKVAIEAMKRTPVGEIPHIIGNPKLRES